MSENRTTDLLGALPRTRPHRRSDKRGARPGGPAAKSGASRKSSAAGTPSAASKPPAARKSTAGKPSAARKSTARKSAAAKRPARQPSGRLRQPAQPGGIPTQPRSARRKTAPRAGAEIVGTAVQATAELAEIGLALSARALRNAVSRLPRP